MCVKNKVVPIIDIPDAAEGNVFGGRSKWQID